MEESGLVQTDSIKKTQTLNYLTLQFLLKKTSMCVPNVMDTYAVVIETFNTKPQMVALLEKQR